MPADGDPGMAFVLVQHLSPDGPSLLTEIVQRFTRMKVVEAKDGMGVLPDCVYVMPPGKDLALVGGSLRLHEHSAAQGPRRPVDFFFRSLAQDCGERAIAIVLSGTGSDGAEGVRAIKAAGGMVMAQSSDSAQSDGMPSSAVATGAVDHELPAEAMAAQLLVHVSETLHDRASAQAAPESRGALDRIFTLLRSRTDHDFSHYKPSSIQRRIERRMAVHQIAEMAGYVSLLQETPEEVDALFRDLLIGVTSFFRDSAAFAALEEAIPRLFAGKPAGTTVRAWSAACSTGEEAYSLAILLSECVERLARGYKLQVFATDVDARAIATARAGVYPSSAVERVSAERLERYFTVERGGGSYRVNRRIRDLIVFSEHDVLKAPPFSRLDLLSCRNLFIYLDSPLQRILVGRFAYALNPGGLLFLGTSEVIGEADLWFSMLDSRASLLVRTTQAHSGRHTRWESRTGLDAPPPPPPAPATTRLARPTMRQVCDDALMRVAPASALVNRNGDVKFLHGRTGMYLEPAPGEAGVPNILTMAREGLSSDLGLALLQADAQQQSVSCLGVSVKTNGGFTGVDLAVHPVNDGAEAGLLFLVTFAGAPERAAALSAREGLTEESAARIALLERELSAREVALGSIGAELRTRNDELRSSVEEMQSMNEELQSSNEELETSTEELKATNEELNSVNRELGARLVDLSRTSDDMNNLVSGTGIGTLFVDRALRIMRFTPPITSVINLIPSDVGRPFAHVVSNLSGSTDLVAEIQAVLDTLVPREVELQTKDGRWFVMRIIPYRTIGQVIEGVVLTFVDIGASVLAREALRKANALARLAVVVRDAHDPITVHDLSGRILAWNPAAERVYGWTEAEALAMNVRECIPAASRDEALVRLKALAAAEVLAPLTTRRLTKSGASVEVTLISTALLDELGKTYAIATTERATSPAADRGESR